LRESIRADIVEYEGKLRLLKPIIPSKKSDESVEAQEKFISLLRKNLRYFLLSGNEKFFEEVHQDVLSCHKETKALVSSRRGGK
jgi:hypothetical protein